MELRCEGVEMATGFWGCGCLGSGVEWSGEYGIGATGVKVGMGWGGGCDAIWEL